MCGRGSARIRLLTIGRERMTGVDSPLLHHTFTHTHAPDCRNYDINCGSVRCHERGSRRGGWPGVATQVQGGFCSVLACNNGNTSLSYDSSHFLKLFTHAPRALQLLRLVINCTVLTSRLHQVVMSSKGTRSMERRILCSHVLKRLWGK